ncbi:hypothetical protein Y032_0146g2544 [Ancylostoma ceylanicum]|nr:hypothetical protein Y032_0146g2544 [Ancylostoma ceylanicum]
MYVALCFVVLTVVSAQNQNARFTPLEDRLPCGFSCSRRTAVLAMVDGVFSRAECSDRNGDVRSRCGPCCEMKALAEGLSAERATGFLSTNGGDCICCFNNNRC